MNRFLSDFNHAIRFTFNKLSYDELRSYIAHKLRNSEAVVPNEQEVPSFLKGLFAIGMIREATNSRFQMLDSIRMFDNYFLNFIKKSRKLQKEIKTFVKFYPLFIGYKNKIDNSVKLIDEFLSKPLDLKNQHDMLGLEFDAFDAIVMMHREKSRFVTFISKV
jgi:hypothetical protein